LLARSHRLVTDSSARLSQLELPTLVLHSRGDRAQPYQRGRDLAARISGARLVALESINHIVLADEPAWPVFLREVTQFLAPDRVTALPAADDDVASMLSPRELDILRLAAEGPRQRRDRSRAGAVGPHGRAAPSKRVCEARSAGPQRAYGGRRAAADPAPESARVHCPSPAQRAGLQQHVDMSPTARPPLTTPSVCFWCSAHRAVVLFS
jgi:hypothetical protein